ncbi:MAG: argininosuccinate lyase [Gaiellaceae bacterium]|nr:argininosuccinate lyase [Gaiellaceae bacterium]MEA2280893.1 argininosuccinate lyase [Solirubrobacteraceae bacterium]
MTETDELGRGGRLSGGAAGELVAAAYAAESAHGPRLAHGLSLADLAHAVALVEGGDLAGDDATGLLRGLLELHAIPGDEFPWDPSLGDAFNAREAELERRVGRSAAGWLSAGRPRREAFRVALRLTARAGARALHDALVDQAAALARHARATRSALATDYTYLQPAQPTTVGHLLLAYAYPALRDADRARASYSALGASVAGAGGSAGSRWSLDRERLAELLGSDGLVEHAKDAAWQADVYLELLATLAIAATHQSQLGQDFEIYASQEFGLVELADAHSRASALMPQKKNPYALAAIRTQAGQASGDVASALVALHTGSARTDHFHLLNGTVPRALDEAVAIARLTASVLDGLELRTQRFEEIAHESFVTAADVADVLALEGGLDYRSAHKVVGRAVRDLVESGEPSSALTPERLAAAAEAAIGRPVEIDEATLRAALDPAACAAARRQTGSSSRAAMDSMLSGIDEQLAERESWSTAARERESAAETALLARARALSA